MILRLSLCHVIHVTSCHSCHVGSCRDFSRLKFSKVGMEGLEEGQICLSRPTGDTIVLLFQLTSPSRQASPPCSFLGSRRRWTWRFCPPRPCDPVCLRPLRIGGRCGCWKMWRGSARNLSGRELRKKNKTEMTLCQESKGPSTRKISHTNPHTIRCTICCQTISHTISHTICCPYDFPYDTNRRLFKFVHEIVWEIV
jgi:hypothetical protein